MLDDVGEELGYLCRAVRGDMNTYIHIHMLNMLTLILAFTSTLTFTLAFTITFTLIHLH